VLGHNADGQSPQHIAKKVFGSTVLLVMEDARGQPVSLGSGFFVRQGELARNLQVAGGASREYAKLVGRSWFV
jgi:S1-C subfamily serine protease